MKDIKTLACNMRSLDDETKNALLVWMGETMNAVGIDDPASRRSMLEYLADLTEIPQNVGTPVQRLSVQGGYIERNEQGEFAGRLELAIGVNLIFATCVNSAAISFSPSAPEFVRTGWE